MILKCLLKTNRFVKRKLTNSCGFIRRIPTVGFFQYLNLINSTKCIDICKYFKLVINKYYIMI